MRVLLLNQVFYPDVAATAQHAHDLARHLTEAGHEVVAIASRATYGKKGADLPKQEWVDDDIEVHRVGRSLFGKAGIAGRLVDFSLFYVAAAIKAFTVRRPDVVVCFTTPPLIALVGWLLRLVRRCRFVYWVMDVYPDIAVACGVMQHNSIATWMTERLNRFCLRRADKVVVLGRCMEQRITGKDIDPESIARIGVWSDQDEVKPVERDENPYRTEWQLGSRLVVMYSGNFGLAHDVVTMCAAAEALREEERIRFVFVGGGKRKVEVEQFVETQGLENVVIAPYQPRSKLDASLSCADIHLVSMIDGAEGSVVPCKLFGIMAAGRPTIFIGHPDSELARVLVEHECGRVVPPGDVDGLIASIAELMENDTLRRSMGAKARLALNVAYSRHAACEQWRELLESLVAPSQQPAAVRVDG
jgi:glycosyltransferase involved in cell wall biosynthesis